jgi:Flp pilus assembly protein TadG
MLVPAAMLVLIVLGAIAVDSSLAFFAQRELDNYATSAANSAAASALDANAFYNHGQIVVDPAAAQRVAAVLRSEIGGGVHDVTVQVATAASHVTVTAAGTVNYIFAPAIPGVAHSLRVRATATATAHQVAAR